jgi:hypothetical protein
MHEELAVRLAEEEEKKNPAVKKQQALPPVTELPVKNLLAKKQALSPVEPDDEPFDEDLAAEVDDEPVTPVVTPKTDAPRIKPQAANDSRRAAFTLRLDAKRHLKLRLASTVRNRSAQQLVTEALDRFLGDIPELEALASQVKRSD